MKHKRRKRDNTNIPRLESLKQINLDAAGVDIGSTELFVCVPEGRDTRPVRVFKSFSSALYEIVVWLKECGVKTVAMESTGIYWVPLQEFSRGNPAVVGRTLPRGKPFRIETIARFV
jgi:transposase